MELITSAQREKLLANGANRGADHEPVVKLFNPCGAGTWLVTELDTEDTSVAFGLADLGFGSPEVGSFSLEELEAFKGPFGLGIERDLYFEGKFSLSVYAEPPVPQAASSNTVPSSTEPPPAADRSFFPIHSGENHARHRISNSGHPPHGPTAR